MLKENIFRDGAHLFGGLVRKHPDAVAELKGAGLFYKAERNDYRGVIRHQLLVAAVVKVTGELAGLPEEQLERVVRQALVHDKDKRRQIENKTREQIIAEERQRIGIASATSTNFNQFPSWGIEEYLLRYADSCCSLKFEPWRDRVNKLFNTKADENEAGRQFYNGMGMWEKLAEVTLACEEEIYRQVINANPHLKGRYPQPEDLFQLISDKLEQQLSE